MNTFRKNSGFTLIEFMVSLVAASVVTLAAATILLLGIRINRQSIDTASNQTTARILLATLEKLATEGAIKEVKSEPDSWQVIGVEGRVLLVFDSVNQKVYAGPAKLAEGVEGAVLMEDVYASHVFLAANGLLEISVETEDGSYASSVFCRTAVMDNSSDKTGDNEVNELLKPETEGDGTDQTVPPGERFLKALASQYAITTSEGKLRNPGLILKKEVNGSETTYISAGKYYSEWYVGSYAANPGWNSQTPWCACFISWALMNGVDGADAKVNFGANTKGFANVDTFMNFLKNNTLGHAWESSKYYSGTYEPVAGDLVFFDWTVNAVRNPEHIGAVIKVSEETVNGVKVKYIYTIEGNSAGRVAVRKYGFNDPRIIGYGVLNWTETQTT